MSKSILVVQHDAVMNRPCGRGILTRDVFISGQVASDTSPRSIKMNKMNLPESPRMIIAMFRHEIKIVKE